jgi:hypothetical protein
MTRKPAKKNYINTSDAIKSKGWYNLKATKLLFVLLLVFTTLAFNSYAATEGHVLRVRSDEAALIRLDGQSYCYVWFEGADASKGTLWLHIAAKEDMNELLNSKKLALGEQMNITLENKTVKVALKSIIDNETALFEINTEKGTITTEVEKAMAEVPSEISSSLIMSASILMGTAFISTAWCLTQGMTINASTTAETGKASNWGTILSISGFMILCLGLLSGLTLLSPDLLPISVIISVIMLLGFVLSLFIVSSGKGARRG